MPLQATPRRLPVLASAVAATSIVLAVSSCSHITPLGPTGAPGPKPVAARATPVPVGFVYKLGSPIILQVMHSQPPTGTGGCPVGLVQVSLPSGAAPLPCFQPVGSTVTITTAAVSPVSPNRPTRPPGQPSQPVSYGFTVGMLPGQVAAVTALIAQAYNSRGALGVTVDGKLWEAPHVARPFQGKQLQITLLSRNQALQLYSLLV